MHRSRWLSVDAAGPRSRGSGRRRLLVSRAGAAPTTAPAAAPKPTTAPRPRASPRRAAAASPRRPSPRCFTSGLARGRQAGRLAVRGRRRRRSCRRRARSPRCRSRAAPPASLKGVCPDTVVMQTNWWPEPDHGLMYQLIGPNGTIDTNKNTYSGPLGNDGRERRDPRWWPGDRLPDGDRPGCTQDDSILLGMGGTDEQIGTSADQPTIAVLAWYAKNPQIFFWGNPDWNFNSVADIGKNGATVLAFSARRYLDVLEGKGALEQEPGRHLVHGRSVALRGRRRQHRLAGLRHRRAVHLRERSQRLEEAGQVPAARQGSADLPGHAGDSRPTSSRRIAPACRSWCRCCSKRRSTM